MIGSPSIFSMPMNTKEAAMSGEKRAKFRELAEARTNRALEAVGRIGKLSNRQFYEWEEAEVRKIIKALRDVVSEVEARFESPKSKAASKFKL
jgi:hypothetical protein